MLEGAGWGPSLVRPLTLLFPLSYKGLVAEALRQLVGEECYRQDEVLPPGYCTGSLAGRPALGQGRGPGEGAGGWDLGVCGCSRSPAAAWVLGGGPRVGGSSGQN